MRLYLVQHGEALRKEENPERPLSDRGQETVRRVAAFLRKIGVEGSATRLKLAFIRLTSGVENHFRKYVRWKLKIKQKIQHKEVSMRLNELESQALKLSPEKRAKLARKLILSLESLSKAEIEQLWIEEALKREAEIEAHVVRLIPAEKAFKNVRARLK